VTAAPSRMRRGDCGAGVEVVLIVMGSVIALWA
jgi:hypothetical protein